jgi:aspartyl-tRNA(Asn)/glutamyl-tRNA(Gln) amidotransferase subunit B
MATEANTVRANHSHHHLPHRGLSGVAQNKCRTVEYDRDTGIATVVASSFEDEAKKQFQTVIGLEIHAQLSSPTKLFSMAPTRHDLDVLEAVSSATPNALVHAFDMGYPGSLPVLSTEAVQAAVLAAKAMNCTIHPTSRFERKHYHYPDLPCGYQVTQQRWPIASEGVLRCRLAWNIQQKKRLEAKIKKALEKNERSSKDKPISSKDDNDSFFCVGIERIQIEQDTGKTTNAPRTTTSLIDLNRAGCALIEVVSRPDIRSAHQAAAFVATLQQLLHHLDVCDGKMQDGSLRCDVNVSIAPLDGDHATDVSCKEADAFSLALPPFCGKRVEVKNLNSIRQGNRKVGVICSSP